MEETGVPNGSRGPAPTGNQRRPGGPGPEEARPPAAEAEKPRRILTVAIPLVFILLVVAGGGYWFVKVRDIIQTDDAVVDGDRMTVSTKVFGRIVHLGAAEGDTVKPGELLVQLDDADLRSRITQAQARLSLARESVKLAEVNVQRSQEDFDRAVIQFEGQAIPKEQLDHAHAGLAAAQAQHSIALAQVQTAQADLDVVRTQLEDTRLMSPFAGVVAKRWVIQGEVVQAGQPILTLYDLGTVWVTAYFEETKLQSIPLGARVEISVDAYPDRSVEGTVVLIGAAAASQFSLIPPNNASGNFTKVTQRIPVRIALDGGSAGEEGYPGPGPGLLPGMSVVVRILGSEG